jgi:sugar transferase (PEP-CTERM/EpsH1 system associated)
MAMSPLLYLVHRIPFPPNKGDKVRSFNVLRFLAQHYDVHLGTFVDTADDLKHVQALERYCASFKAIRLTPIGARLRSAAGLWKGGALSVHHYSHPDMSNWVEWVIAKHRITSALVFSPAMAQYVAGRPGLRTVVDFVDADSLKWRQYASARPWPISAIYARESKRVLEFDRRVAKAADASIFVTSAEAKLFTDLAPESADGVHVVPNGVDTEFFAPGSRPSPYPDAEEPIVFTGAMNYWPNVDAAVWFAHAVLPPIAKVRRNVRFYVVGRDPVAAVRALARDASVTVTGRVDDVRPYLQHARVAVAPLRIARGIQNKTLEAMAMACPLVVSEAAAGSLPGVAGTHFEIAGDAEAFAAKCLTLFEPRGRNMGAAARALVLSKCNWDRNLAAVAGLLRGRQAPNAAPPAHVFRAGKAIAEHL